MGYVIGGKVDSVGHIRVFRYKGYFDWDYFYRGLLKYFKDRGYYWNENRIKDTGSGLKWDVIADRDYNEFIHVQYKLKFIFYDIKRFKMKVDGRERTIFRGRFEAEVVGTYTIDRLGIFKGKGKFIELLGKIFVAAKTRDWETSIQDEVDYGVRKIIREMKRLVNSWTKDQVDWGIKSA